MQQDDLQERETHLKRDGMLLGIAACSLLNGMPFSPLFDPAFVLFRVFAPGFFISSLLLLYYFTSLLLSAATLIIAGVPAALFERIIGRTQTDTISLGIWLATTVVLALPSVMSRAGMFS